MVARYVFLGVIAAGALGAAASLLPGDLERLSMLERDGRHEEAMGELQRQYDAGQRDPRIMIRLYNLKVRFGAIDEAQRVLEDYAQRRPQDTQVQLSLVRFYQTTQQEGAYLTALRALYERTRLRELQNELLGFYRMAGRFQEEEELLDRSARANRATPAEFERLGMLAAARGDLPQAARALRRADGRLDEQSQGARMALFRVLVELKEPEEAHQRAVSWLRSWRQPGLAIDFMEGLSQAGRLDLALDISGRFGGAGSEVTLVGAELLDEHGRNAEATTRLKEYLDAGLPEDSIRAERVVALAASLGQTETALRAARHVGLRKLAGDIVIDLIDAVQDALATRNRSVPPELLKGFAAEIEARIANTQPLGDEASDRLMLPDDLRLFAGQMAVSEGDLDLGRRHLAALDPDKLNADDLTRWTDLQVTAGLRSSAFPNLPRVWRSREPTDPVARRVQRVERAQQQEVQTASGRLGAPAAQPGAAPAAIASAPATSPATSQAAPQDAQPPRARRSKRRPRYIDRYRDTSKQAAARGKQAETGEPVQPKASPAPALVGPFGLPLPTPFPLPGQVPAPIPASPPAAKSDN